MAAVGVAGAGVMGVGVAQNLAQAGHEVILIDTSTEVLARAREQIRRNCRASRLFGGPAVDAE
jgi:3-hydroxybutyryl-CoA dehydrogenase